MVCTTQALAHFTNLTAMSTPLPPVVQAATKCPEYGFLHARCGGRMIPAFIHPDATPWLRENWDAGEHDILICTHQKVGTHLTKKYVVEILRAAGRLDASHPAREGDIGKAAVPWPEVMVSQKGASAFQSFLARTEGQPRIIYTHANADELPVRSVHPNTKLIMTYRDPKGAAISQYHFYRNHPTLGVADHLPLSRFIDFFLEGDLYFGDYHHHVASYADPSAHGIRPEQLLVLRFEDLVERKLRSVRSLSRFLLGHLLPFQATLDVAQRTEFNTMKSAIRQNPGSFHFNPDRFFRSGRTDDWAEQLSPQDIRRIDAKTQQIWNPTLAPQLQAFTPCSPSSSAA